MTKATKTLCVLWMLTGFLAVGVVIAWLSLIANVTRFQLPFSLYNETFKPSVSMSWAAEGGFTYDSPGAIEEQSQFFLKRVLTSRIGWQRSGVQFLSAVDADNANILFLIVDEKTLKQKCGLGSACAETTESVSMWPFFDSKPAQCRIFLPDSLKNRESSYRRAFSFVNHEVGHCLGLGHSFGQTDIMSGWDAVIPNEHEIRIAQSNIR